jgi:hypothetical protein
VPIKSLLGHRSQAPPEVRHVSGQHIKEFRDFLAKYPEDFVVNDEVIYLKEYEGKITQRYCESSSGTCHVINNDRFSNILDIQITLCPVCSGQAC